MSYVCFVSLFLLPSCFSYYCYRWSVDKIIIKNNTRCNNNNVGWDDDEEHSRLSIFFSFLALRCLFWQLQPTNLCLGRVDAATRVLKKISLYFFLYEVFRFCGRAGGIFF
jgi:hypothetical protein